MRFSRGDALILLAAIEEGVKVLIAETKSTSLDTLRGAITEGQVKQLRRVCQKYRNFYNIQG